MSFPGVILQNGCEIVVLFIVVFALTGNDKSHHDIRPFIKLLYHIASYAQVRYHVVEYESHCYSCRQSWSLDTGSMFGSVCLSVCLSVRIIQKRMIPKCSNLVLGIS